MVLTDTAEEDTKEIRFETALEELERIVQEMEGGRLPLEESIQAYRRGSELLRNCQRQLADAERQIQVFEKGELRDANLDTEVRP
ncbi:MAG: exodeoxyribonuclease VII small subunit [Candidatus Accumulibacter sp.]|jgi:exodeoxyribonuclease VII small subunit|nr:exodeoxyribonuclease VII small subunit [Accumulibacter sp.]